MNTFRGVTADYYAILEVERNADEATINASYRRLARQKHPDKNRTNPKATAEFQDLNKAYSVLRDSRQRRDYDQLNPFSRYRPSAPATPSTDRTYQYDPKSAARAAAATAAENAKTPEQRRADADAALKANAARHSNSGKRKQPFRFVRVPENWDRVPDGPVSPFDNMFAENPASKTLKAEINALRRAMRQGNEVETALRRQQRQLGTQMDEAWVRVSERMEAIRLLEMQKTALLAEHVPGYEAAAAAAAAPQPAPADDWFEGLFGVPPQQPQDAGEAADASAGYPEILTKGVEHEPKVLMAMRQKLPASVQRLLDGICTNIDSVRADVEKMRRALEDSRVRSRSVVAQIEKIVAKRQAQDEQLKDLAARYRQAEFKSSAKSGDESFDGWVAWEEPEEGCVAKNLWDDEMEKDDMWEDAEAAQGDLLDPTWTTGNDGQGKEAQWFSLNADATEWMSPPPPTVDKEMETGGSVHGKSTKRDASPVDIRAAARAAYVASLATEPEPQPEPEPESKPALKPERATATRARRSTQSDNGTNVWDDGYGSDRFNADLLHIGSDDGHEQTAAPMAAPTVASTAANTTGKNADQTTGKIAAQTAAQTAAAAADYRQTKKDPIADWYFDEDLCGQYTERLKLDEDSWRADICGEW